MAEFNVTMCRAEGITEAERRRRMHQAYQILLNAAARKAANREKPSRDSDRLAADDADHCDRHYMSERPESQMGGMNR